MDANNTKMINALTTAVLANVTDYDITCEITRRGLNLDISTLSDDAIREEANKRCLTFTVTLEQVLNLLDAERAEWITGGCPDEPLDLLGIARALPDEILWEAIREKDGIGAKWAYENPSDALEAIDEIDKERYAREWVSDNMSEVISDMDMDVLVDELGPSQKSDLLVALAQAADF